MRCMTFSCFGPLPSTCTVEFGYSLVQLPSICTAKSIELDIRCGSFLVDDFQRLSTVTYHHPPFLNRYRVGTQTTAQGSAIRGYAKFNVNDDHTDGASEFYMEVMRWAAAVVCDVMSGE